VARTELAVVIKRPPEDVWALINDMERYSVAWGEHYTVTSPGPLGLGSTLSEDDGETATVTEYEPMRAFSIDVDTRGHWALKSARLGHVLEPVPEGTRFVTWLEPHFTLRGRLLQPVLAALYRRAARKPVNGVKRYLEEGPPTA
jgi:hypothetical protein